MSDPIDAFTSATGLVTAIRAGEVSSLEVLEALIERVERFNGVVNAVVTVDYERARADARRADSDLRDGRSHGPLHGLPLTIKDALETEGMRSTGGAEHFRAHHPRRDAIAVERVRAAGGIVFGKTNVPAWSGDLQTYNSMFGTTNNPWDLSTTSGGSSGGAAVALACGFTPLEVGTDAGGSIRMPAHMCGVFGLRPTYGVVPQHGYLAGPKPVHAGLDLNVIGPLARDPEDLALALGVLAGPAGPERHAWRLHLPEDRRPLDSLRIGLWLDDPSCPVDPAYRACLEQVAMRLERAGAEVVQEHPRMSFEELTETCRALNTEAHGLNASLGGRSHREWLELDDRRHQFRHRWQEWFETFDVLLAAVLPTAAFPHDHAGSLRDRQVQIDGVDRPHTDLVRWPALVTALGLPVCVAPIGLVGNGLPVGVQIIAGAYRDLTAVNVAGHVAAVTGGFRVPPGFE